MGKLDGKVALVTGGNNGLGKALVTGLLKEGAKVAFCGRTEERNQAALEEYLVLSSDVMAVRCDVGNSQDVKEMYRLILERFGTLDILINNAAVTGGRGMHKGNGKTDRENFLNLTTLPGEKYSLEITKNLTDEEWENNIRINLNGVFYCTREALKIMEEKRYGKIINISSIAGISNMSAHSPAYAAAKGGVVAFTRNLAVEVAGAGINVNCVAPGGIQTPGFEQFTKMAGPDVTGRMMQSCPMNRLGTPKEHSAMVIFLATDDASYITGQVIATNGGMF